MTEAAIKRAKKQKINRIIIIASAIILVLLIVLWIVQFNITNSKAIPQLVEYYEPGEYVEIGDNFYVDAVEQLDGYSIRVNGAKLVNYKDYIENNGGTVDMSVITEDYPMPQYSILLDITIKNENNTEGSLMVLKYMLYERALTIPVDFQIWQLIDENFDGYPFLRLVENTEADMIIPFSPNTHDTGTNEGELERRMEEEDFYFCISEFPVRKMIRVPIENCVE